MQKNKRTIYWVLTFVWTLMIYSTLSLVSIIRQYLEQRIPLNSVLTVCVCLTLVTVIIFFFKNLRRKLTTFRYVLLVATIIAYLYGIFTIKYPVEKIHFVQYGLLVFFAFRALECDFKKWIPYIGAFLLTVLVGFGDELIQGILPNRYYDIRDVVLNAVSTGLALVLVYVFE